MPLFNQAPSQVSLDGIAGDIQPLGAQAAGNSTKAAAANHVHPNTAPGARLAVASTITAYSTTSTTSVDIDTSHLVVTFTAPPSGNVIAVLTGLANQSTAGVERWDLRSGGSEISGTLCDVVSSGVAGPAAVCVKIPVTGLTPGNSFTWTWGWLTTSGSGTSRLNLNGTGYSVLEVTAN